MLDAELTDACFGMIADPEVVAAAIGAGLGATIRVSLGGKTDDLHGSSLSVTATVRVITDGTWTSQTYAPGITTSHGRMVRLTVRGLEVLVAEKRSQVYEPELFALHGIDVTQMKVVGLKSSNHFRASFAPIASAIITADSPGLSTLTPGFFTRAALPRPFWPLSPDASYPPV
jgi:microcystin degradation protein MlrC